MTDSLITLFLIVILILLLLVSFKVIGTLVLFIAGGASLIVLIYALIRIIIG